LTSENAALRQRLAEPAGEAAVVEEEARQLAEGMSEGVAALGKILDRFVGSLDAAGKDRYARRGMRVEPQERPQGQRLSRGFEALYQLGRVLQDLSACAESVDAQKAARR
jgi:hypothetical protein